MQSMNYELDQLIGDAGEAAVAALVVVGDRLGLYKALAGMGPATPRELAAQTGTHEMYISEWLTGQAASGHVAYDPSGGLFHMSPEQVRLLADENSPEYRMRDFYTAASKNRDRERLPRAFRSGKAGRRWTLRGWSVL